MGLLSSLYQQQQQINQNPTSAVRTPIQNAYDNLLNAQANAQNTAKEEWGSAIGNSVNGLAKIIASSVIGNPIEKAASTRNLDNFDARQDALVRQWAMEQAKKRNDFVNQAREQLGIAKADEEQAYNRELTKQQIAYKKLQDELAQKNYEQEQEVKANNRAEDVDFRERTFKWQQDEAERKRKDAYEQAQREAEAKALAEQQKKEEEELKKKEEKIKSTQSLLDSYNSAGAIEPKDYLALRKLAATDPDKVYELLQDSGNYKESGLILGFLPWKTAGNKNKFKLGVNLDNKNTKGL